MNKETGKVQTGMVEVFNFSQERKPVRVCAINGAPWFVAKDVCEVLGISKYRDSVAALDEDERGSVLMDTLGGKQQMAAINESGLYHLIFQSRKAEARKFRKWVTGEVLPSIRRKGYYGQPKGDGDYLDARDIPYGRVGFLGSEVRTIDVEGTRWYSVNDIHAAMGSRTDSTQAARQLNARQPLARKILAYGATQPAWHTTLLGMRLLMSGCRKELPGRSRQLTIDFNGKEARP